MNKRFVWSVALLLNLCLLIFSSCRDEKDSLPANPVVNLTEIGRGNNRTGVAGADLHLEGHIFAEGIIRRIDIEIHLESGGNFKIEKSYTEGKYIEVKNADFHEHIGIPAEAPAGDYHLHFSVTDRSGQTTTTVSELSVVTE